MLKILRMEVVIEASPAGNCGNLGQNRWDWKGTGWQMRGHRQIAAGLCHIFRAGVPKPELIAANFRYRRGALHCHTRSAANQAISACPMPTATAGRGPDVVRVVGLEPTLLAETEFESVASTIPPHPQPARPW